MEPDPYGSALISRGVLAMPHLYSFARALRDDEDGQGLAEYALILGLIAVVAIVSLIFLGNQVSTILSKVGGSL